MKATSQRNGDVGCVAVLAPRSVSFREAFTVSIPMTYVNLTSWEAAEPEPTF